jgi:hypothetical protein
MKVQTPPHRMLLNGITKNDDTGKYAAGSIRVQKNKCPILCFPSSPIPKHKNKRTTSRKWTEDNSIVNLIKLILGLLNIYLVL